MRNLIQGLLMNRTWARWIPFAIIVAIGVYVKSNDKDIPLSSDKDIPFDSAACEGPRLKSVEERNRAMEEGHVINQGHQCIDKVAYAAARKREAHFKAAEALPNLTSAPTPVKSQTLVEARKAFTTQVAIFNKAPLALPAPPVGLFVRADFASAPVGVLPAFVTPDPKDGRKHPAVIWLTGGDSAALDDFWTQGPDSNDQSASPLRRAGLVMMFPTLRGGHSASQKREYFLGEVDDVLAAAQHLATLPYVDPLRIYLGGHSTGGTLALLTAASTDAFRAVFSFGPVAHIEHYPPSILPIAQALHDAHEKRLRSPIYWLHGLTKPAYILEGEEGNISSFNELCSKTLNVFLQCIPISGANHFSALAKGLKVVAARIALDEAGTPLALTAQDFK